jgi:tRNA nucleotidyltransferase/poly(A) polymerase
LTRSGRRTSAAGPRQPAGAPVPREVAAKVARVLGERRNLRRFLSACTRAAADSGGESFLVGGFVRDIIEGGPGNDVDVMIAGVGSETLGGILRSLPADDLGILRVLPVGKRFPVYKVRTAWSEVEIDVAPARGGASGRTGRDLAREDASRRDFTINSLMIRLRATGRGVSGDVVDVFGGLDDMQRRRIRAVGDPGERFREDPLRMLRAIRLRNERPGSVIERRTIEAMRRDAPSLLATVPGDRIAGELVRSLRADPAGTVRDLHRAGILPLLLPEVPTWDGSLLMRAIRRYRLLERSLDSPLPEPVLQAGLLVDAAEVECASLLRPGPDRKPGAGTDALLRDRAFFRLPRTEAAARRLHLPRLRETLRLVEDLVRLENVNLLRNPLAQVESVLGRWKKPDRLLALYDAAQKAAGRRTADFRRLLSEAAKRPPLLSGRELLEMGMPAGPEVEVILEEVREATLAGRVTDREEARRLAMTLIGRKDGRSDRRKAAAVKSGTSLKTQEPR